MIVICGWLVRYVASVTDWWLAVGWLHLFVGIFCPWDHGSNVLIITTQAHDWFVPHWCVADWWMRSTTRGRTSCSKRLPTFEHHMHSSNLAYEYFFSLSGSQQPVSISVMKHQSSLINFEHWLWPQACRVFDLVHRLSIVVKWHCRDTGQ